MTKPRSKPIKPVSEPQPPGHEHLLGRYQRFPLPAISATPLRISHSPIRKSKVTLGKFTHADAGQIHLCLNPMTMKSKTRLPKLKERGAGLAE